MEYLDGKAPLNHMIMTKKRIINFVKQASPYWNTTPCTVLLLAVILTEIMRKNCCGSFRTNKVALFSKIGGVCVSVLTLVCVCISYSVLTYSLKHNGKQKNEQG